MTLIDPADTSAPRSYTLRGIALLACAGMVAAVSLLAIPGSAQAATAAASNPSVVVPAVAAGPLTPQGCTPSGTTDTCHLYAMAGTTSMLGGAPINIWGFSSTGVAGSATAPGPLLVVNQGDTVSVTLHNQIAGQQVSLTFPGQPTSNFTSGLSAVAEEVGIGSTAPANTITYSFTAARAGTFIYEAGHTANGTRQVAMGLAGALVVLPPIVPAVAPAVATHNAYGVVTGYPDTTYADDAVVVLSEIDPALNAAPATFDMRKFAPKYRLINGKPYPSTDVISTNQGHVVLLRYVNVGSQDHSMSLLGVDQTQVAEDGHAMKYGESEVAMAVTTGATADTLVTMPTGPETKVALYEAAGRLDNNGQNTGGSQYSLAFGGMLTFLDTAFVDPNPLDRVGPVSSHVTASPNPSNGATAVTVTADISDATTGNSNVDQAEIVIDDASPTGLAPGFGIPMTGGFGSPNVVGARGTISPAVLATLSAGKHTVFVRAHDTAMNWGVVGATILNLPKTGPQTTNGSATPSPANGSLDVAISATGDDSAAKGTIDGAEYFLDTVGANSSGTPITPNRVASVVSLDPVIPAATVLALTEGVHHVFVRSHDSLGLWGPTLDIPLSVDKTGPGVDGADVKPNPTNAILTTTAHPGYLWVSASITDPNSGGSGNTVADAEFFLDTIGAPGTGAQLAPVDGAMNTSTESVAGGIPISQVRPLSNGTHHVSVRGQDAAGNWGPIYTMSLIVDKTAPVLGSVTGSQNPTTGVVTLTAPLPANELGGFGAAEFWLGTTAPVAGKGTSVPVAVVGANIVATVPLAGLPAGTQRFNLRVQDAAGNWSNAVNTTVTVRLNGIFASPFSLASGNFGWNGKTGGPTVTPAAGIPPAAGNTGLQVAEAGGGTNRTRFMTDTTPTAEASYHASFAFNANNLATTSVLTLFEGRAAAQVFAVQLRQVGGVNQIGTVMAGQAGPTTWVTLPTGPHTIQVDWLAATSGSLQLQLDGAPVSTLTGNTNTSRVETAFLGLTAGVTNTVAGTAFFDNFVSTRFTLP